MTLAELPGAGENLVFKGLGDVVLVCSPDREGLECNVADITSGSVVAHFHHPSYPVKVWPDTEGWFLSTVSLSQMPTVASYDSRGARRGELVVPEEVVAGAMELLGEGRGAMSPRLFGVNGEVWAIPAGLYEFWRIAPGPPRRVEVPECLRVAGHHFSGELATRRMEEGFRCAGGEAAAAGFASLVARMRSAIALSGAVSGGGGGGQRGAPAQGRTFINAVGGVVVSGNRLAIRLELGPQAVEPRSRIDVWSFPGPRLVASEPVTGSFAKPVELTANAVWLACGGRVERVALSTKPANPCDGTSGVHR